MFTSQKQERDGCIQPKITHLTRLLHSLNNHGELVKDRRGYLILKCCSGLCLTRKAPLILTEETEEQIWSLRTDTFHKNSLMTQKQFITSIYIGVQILKSQNPRRLKKTFEQIRNDKKIDMFLMRATDVCKQTQSKYSLKITDPVRLPQHTGTVICLLPWGEERRTEQAIV